MKKAIFIVLFVLIAGSVMANDWRVISDVKYMVMEYIVVGNIRTAETINIIINQGIITFSSPEYFVGEFTTPNSTVDSKNHGKKLIFVDDVPIISNEKMNETLRKERCKILQAVGDYQKNKVIL